MENGNTLPYLSVEQVSKSMGSHRILSDVNFSVQKGEFVSILGPSGSGKSTLLRLIAGLDMPDSGTITCDGSTFFAKATATLQRVETRDIGMVFQDFGLWPHMTVFDHVAFPLLSRKRRGSLRASKQDIQTRTMETLRLFHMESFATKKPHQLSGGQQQRVAFARAIVSRPKLVLLDEAFSALDPQLRAGVRAELTSILKEHHMTVLSVTHDQEEAMAISDKILLLHEGQTRQFATPDALYEQPADKIVAAFIGKANLVPVKHADTTTVRLADGGHLALPQVLQDTSTLGKNEGHLLVRPEFLFVIDERTQETIPVQWTGHVLSQTQLLGRYEVTVQVEGIGKLTLYHDKRLQPGQTIELGLHIERPHVVYEVGHTI